MQQIIYAKNAVAGGLTYYGGYPLKTRSTTPTNFGLNERSVYNTPAGDYTVDAQYDKNTGEEVISEFGNNNGVTADIVNVYDKNGNVLFSDTTYNGFNSNHPQFRELERRFTRVPQSNYKIGGKFNYLNFFN